MEEKKYPAYDWFKDVDRMINEGLGSGSVKPEYSDAHLRLKEKELRMRKELREKLDKNKSVKQ